MAQTGYTPISLYYSATASTAPTAGNLVAGELAINTNDGKLYYKDSAGVVQTIASKAGNVNVSSFSAGTTGLTPSTATTGAVTLAGTLVVGNGGTGLTTLAANRIPYGNGTGALQSTSNFQYGTYVANFGVSPSAYDLTGYYALEVGKPGGGIFNGLGDIYFTQNAYYGTSAFRYGTSTIGAGIYGINNNLHSWKVAPAGTAGNAITFTTAMTLDGSSNLSVTGSATATSFIPSSSTVPTNGMYLPAANTVGFSTATTERMRISATGLVFIGSASGSAKLNVTGDSGIELFNSAATNQSDIGFSDAQTLSIATYHASGSAIKFNTTPSGGSSTERLRIDANGYVGIGTSSPTYPLEVVANSTTTATVKLRGASANNISTITFDNNAGNASANASYIQGLASASGFLAFATINTERMRIDASGNVGIGTSSPSTKLEVVGNSAVLSIKSANDSGSNYIAFKNTSGTTLWDTGIGNTVRQDEYVIRRAGTAVMYFSNTGGVSIGNSTDAGASGLRVSGLIYPQQATTAAAPAYVKGAIYFDTTLNKLRVGGATAWETITSV